MKKPILPNNENERIQDLLELNILDTPIQESFERVTRLTKSVFQVPIVAFSLVDAERQWFKSIQGLDVCETTREVSFCGHTINQDGIFIVNDTLLDKDFADNPLVIEDPKIRFYAGYPVKGLNKQKIGTLCIIDQKPRQFSQTDLAMLKDMAALLETEITANKVFFERIKLVEELSNVKKTALIDGLTGLLNRKGVENLLQQRIQHAVSTQENFGIALIDVDNFKKINDELGHCAGDKVLRQIARRLLTGYRDSDIIGRWGGEEFLVILELERQEMLPRIAERAREIVCQEDIHFEGKNIKATITTGVSWFDFLRTKDLSSLVSKADKALYVGKNNGKNTVIVSSDESILRNESKVTSETDN